jgi:hypothetical protein
VTPSKPLLTAFTPGGAIWESYAVAYERRYRAAPVRNAKANALCKQLASRLPVEEGPPVAAFYLSMADAFYARGLHPLDLLVRDAEQIRTRWATGNRTTQVDAREREQQDYNVRSMKTFIARGKSKPAYDTDAEVVRGSAAPEWVSEQEQQHSEQAQTLKAWAAQPRPAIALAAEEA